ncbi:MAG: type II toxin-antitoxin system Phd/YefM family antitoxin [Verrucomicrobia bacterium]|nr:type II toxin-antitoxin system Phd/YefM family antitoxin [Verrucomicrobiota bacterium]MDA1065098.1 type II toxin-antitoxin system Phd/YefM family antitoxin [Verrucomicrobiota bacterium]
MKVELVTSLKRRATQIIKELKKDNEPILITEHGKPAAYLVDVDSFEAISKRTQLLEGLARGEAAIQDGRVVPHSEAKIRMSRWLK